MGLLIDHHQIMAAWRGATGLLLLLLDLQETEGSLLIYITIATHVKESQLTAFYRCLHGPHLGQVQWSHHLHHRGGGRGGIIFMVAPCHSFVIG